MSPTQTTQALQWRYATKVFDKTKKISEQDMQDLRDALQLSPSSFGVQPWAFVEVANPELRTQLKGFSWNQAQVEEASHLFVLCRLTKIDEAYIKEFIQDTAAQRNIPVESLAGYQDMIVKTLTSRTQDQLNAWMDKQLYIALGFLMVTAAQKGIDTCPMEGFSTADYDRVLGLTELGLSASVVCPVGYRSETDKYAHLPKVRFSQDRLFIKR